VFFQLLCDIFSCDLEETKMIDLDLTVMEMEIEYWAIKYSIAIFFYLFPNPPMIHPPYIFECINL
jgi:hypothetical protein